MSKKTLALIFGLTIVTAFLIYIAVSQKPSSYQNLATINKTPNPTPTISLANTTLSFSPSSLSVTGQATSTVDVVIDSQTNKVTGVQLELTYDPKTITVLDITSPKTDIFIPSPMLFPKKIDPANGRITFSVGVSPTNTAPQGVGKVATLSFRSNLKANDQTTIQFLPQTLVTAEEDLKSSVLKSTQGLVIMASPSSTIVGQ